MSSGGFGAEQPINEQVRAIALQMKGSIEAKLGMSFSNYQPTGYQTQVVAGTNYRIKITVDGKMHVCADIYEPLPGSGDNLSLSDASIA